MSVRQCRLEGANALLHQYARLQFLLDALSDRIHIPAHLRFLLNLPSHAVHFPAQLRFLLLQLNFLPQLSYLLVLLLPKHAKLQFGELHLNQPSEV